MKPFYSHYEHWEDYKSGMYLMSDVDDKDSKLINSITLLKTTELFYETGLKLIHAWPVSSKVNLSNLGQNRRAWLGAAACCYKYSAPEFLTRIAWSVLNKEHQDSANSAADRIDEPFGETQRKGLWLYQIIEPKTWGKMVLRVSGANQGSLYSEESGNILGNRSLKLPSNHTWESYARFLLNTMPSNTSEHYKNKIAVYLKWYKERGYPDNIPDFGDKRLETLGKIPSWRIICKVLLRNDYWCIGLGFGPTKRDAYNKYLDLMRKRRNNWKIFEETKTEQES